MRKLFLFGLVLLLTLSTMGFAQATTYEEIKAVQVKKMMDGKENFIMVDIRKGINADKFWIDYPDRILTSLDGLEEAMQDVSSSEKVVIVDAVGKRSNVAARYLHLKGYSRVTRLSGGADQWLKDGFAVGTPKQ